MHLKFGDEYLELLKKSKSQLRQDLFVISELNFKHGGYFVEFGASDGITFSNSYLLETEYGYNGILAEPNPSQRRHIQKLRNVNIVEKCVWGKSGEILKFVDAGDLSTVKDLEFSDLHGPLRANRPIFQVETISLTDMLEEQNAPKIIDYLSIDTEGSELQILSEHDFGKFKFKIITVEHNYSADRKVIYELLTKHGYNRIYSDLSQHDDWYVLAQN